MKKLEKIVARLGAPSFSRRTPIWFVDVALQSPSINGIWNTLAVSLLHRRLVHLYVQFEFTFTGLILSGPVCDTDVEAFICKLDCRYSPSAASDPTNACPGDEAVV